MSAFEITAYAAAVAAISPTVADANAIPLVLFLLFINRIKRVQSMKKKRKGEKRNRVIEKYFMRWKNGKAKREDCNAFDCST